MFLRGCVTTPATLPKSLAVRRLFSSSQKYFATAGTSLPQTIRQLLARPESSQPLHPVEVSGWVKSVRRQKNVTFAVISDGSWAPGMQAVLSNTNIPKNLTNGASVRLGGTLVKSLGAGQAQELRVDTVDVLGDCDPETYPIQKQALSVEYLRENAHLRPRTDAVASMLRLRSELHRAVHGFFEGQDFTHVHTPILTSSDCEGAGETFRVVPNTAQSTLPEGDAQEEFFSKPAYLTVSSQLHLEALASSLSRVYTLSPCFRAERSQTSRHLAEFWMLEAEWAFTRSVDDVCDLVEACLKGVLARITPDSSLPWSDGRLRSLLNAGQYDAWARMTYTDAVAELERHHASSRAFEFEPKWGRSLQSEHERWLSESFIGGPVFVTDYPASLKPFYMRLNDDRKTVACFDLLIPHVGELVGGSLREERLDYLVASMKTHGLDEEEYKWYTDLRRFGSAPHGGFGMGFERLVSWLSGIENVRECIAMPRWAKRMLL
ncbi:asparaginyl-tRNA synthetase [Leucogyrophana mollusca]|uniref:Asparaginyl-tRNA synthetase n=1 Tax=Leucogyrophana mollusca TaxID=85980 RepID=A0ACB8BKX9_9AGAM|nr:asparaginyl-tRNA synthetase [Leucogyrophana mollusca]